MTLLNRFSILLFAVLLGSCTTIPDVSPEQQEVRVAPFVIAANPLAARAGMDVLERGGNAADAALAVQAMLSLVEPQSSGMGGGAFLTYYDASSRSVAIYDGRETAPAQASRTMFLDSSGKPLDYPSAVTSGRATGVPGAVAALAMLHAEHGALAWDGLFDAAIHTAEEGFLVSPRLGRFLERPFPQLAQPDADRYFSRADGTRLQVGDRLQNAEYADFLRRLSAQGIDALYKGMKPGGIVGVIDHVGEGSDTRELVDNLHRIDPTVVKADFERAGFVLVGESDILANPEDDHTKLVFDPSIRGKTDRFLMKFVKPDAGD